MEAEYSLVDGKPCFPRPIVVCTGYSFGVVHMEFYGSLYGGPWPNNPKISWGAAEVHAEGDIRLKDHNESFYTRSSLIAMFPLKRRKRQWWWESGSMSACWKLVKSTNTTTGSRRPRMR